MTRLRALPDPDHLPALGLCPNEHPPRILLLYGSLRDRSFSRLCVEEAARLLRFMGCEARIFDPSDLPLTDQVDYDGMDEAENICCASSATKSEALQTLIPCMRAAAPLASSHPDCEEKRDPRDRSGRQGSQTSLAPMPD